MTHMGAQTFSGRNSSDKNIKCVFFEELKLYLMGFRNPEILAIVSKTDFFSELILFGSNFILIIDYFISRSSSSRFSDDHKCPVLSLDPPQPTSPHPQLKVKKKSSKSY